MKRQILALVVVCLAMVAPAGAVEVSPAEIANRRCLNCHAQPEMATRGPADRAVMVAPSTQPSKQPAPPTRPTLFVTADSLAKSVHAKLACIECHQDAQTLPHPAKLTVTSCATCHKNAGSEMLQGAHAMASAKGHVLAPTCVTCHGAHDILTKTSRQSHTHPLNLVKVCGDCHARHRDANGNGSGKLHVDNYLESVHGKGVRESGLLVSATCADCHGNHKVLASKEPQSLMHRDQVAKTCGKCHVGLEETFNASVHGRELAKGNKDAPVCTDCHAGHRITRTDAPAFMLDIVSECGQCHDKPSETGKASLYETYRRSYHGQITALGSTRGARCSDCHGAHDIQRINDSNSRLNAQNRVASCRQCHKDATASFAQFQPHADHHDGRRYPLLHGVWLYFVIMMSAAFGFFGLHSVLWFGRSVIERVKHGPIHHGVSRSNQVAVAQDSEGKDGPSAQGKEPDRAGPDRGGTVRLSPSANERPRIRRFTRVDRVNHAFVIISFFGLTLTGMPLLYADQQWARTLATMFGGVRAAGIFHRIFAVMLICNFAVHFVGVARRIKKYGLVKLLFGPTTMLPRIKDFKDCLGMFRWFFKGGKKPAFDRWTYWEKFDYVAEVGGSAIIGISGLMLWFPIFFSSFVPGWMFNVATIVHGYEALLAVGFIFTIHFFNAHLRLEKFPVDDVMFTGSLPEEEFKEERRVEYDRLVANGELEALKVAPPRKFYRVLAVTAGIVAMAIGTTIIVLIILAGLNLM